MMKKLLATPVAFLLYIIALSGQCSTTDTLEHWIAHEMPGALTGVRSPRLTIEVVDPSVIWAFGQQKIATTPTPQFFWYRSTDGGCTWQSGLIAPFGYFCVGAVATSASTACVLTLFGRVFRTTDGGQSWSNPMPLDAFTGIGAGAADFIHFFNQNDGVICGDGLNGYFEIYTTSDGGHSWARVPAANLPILPNERSFLLSQYSAQGDTIWAPTSRGRIFRSIDKGLHWTYSEPFPPITSSLLENSRIAFRDAKHGLYYTALYGSWRSEDGGSSWAPTPPQPKSGKNLKALPGTNTYLLSANYPYLSNDDGQTWAQLGSQKVYGADFISPGIGWAAWDGDQRSYLLEWRHRKIILSSQPLANIALTTLRQATPLHRDVTYMGLANPPTDIRTDWTVTYNGSPLLSDSKTAKLPSNGYANAPFEFQPTRPGIYELTTQSTELGHASPFFDKKTRITITDTLISHAGDPADPGSNYDNGGSGITGGTPIGVELVLGQQDTLTGFSLWYKGGDPGHGAFANAQFSVHAFSPGSQLPDVLLAQSPTKSVSSADVGSWVYVALASPLVLKAGKYVIAYGFLNILSTEIRYVGYDWGHADGNIWIFTAQGTPYPFSLADTDGAAMVRAHFKPSGTVSTESVAHRGLSVAMSPNPTDGLVILSTFLEKSTDLRLQVFDGAGKLLLEKIAQPSSGAWRENLDLTDFPMGVYWIKMTDGISVWMGKVFKVG